MKILHVVPSYKPAYIYGGPIESVARMCEELVRAGHTVEVFTTTANGAEELKVAPGVMQIVDGVRVTYFKRITKDPTHVSPVLWKKLRAEVKHYDVVHIHSWWNILVMVAVYICYRQKVKVVLSPRGMLSDYVFQAKNGFVKKGFHQVIGKRLLRTTYFHATAPSEEAECRTLIRGWKGFTVPNIIWLPRLQLKPKQNDRFTILFLSRIHPKKGIEYLLKAIHLLGQDVCLKIAGSGEEAYVHQLQELVKVLGLEHAVEWLGWRDRMGKFKELEGADLFALVSHNENFANAVIESLHAGTPVLVSEGVGLSPYVKQEGLGWVTPLDELAIAKQLQHILDNREMLERIHVEAPMKIEQSFSPGVLTEAYINCYQSVVGGLL